MTERDTRRRRHARKAADSPFAGEVAGKYDVQVLDLSFGGARLEHSTMLRPGDICFLRVALRNRSLRLTGRIVWSRVVGRTGGARGTLVFQSGVAFDKLLAGSRNVIAGFLEEPPSPEGWRALLEWRDEDADAKGRRT